MSKSVALMKPGGASAYDFGSPHPLRPERFMLTYEHVRRLGLDKKSNVFEVEPRLVTTAELAAVHDPDYVEIVERIEAGDIPA